MNKAPYVPQIIPIGPSHHDSNYLNTTKGYKLQGLRNFLSCLYDHKEKSLEELVKVTQS